MKSKTWIALEKQAKRLEDLRIESLFDSENRFSDFSRIQNEVLLDFSKTKLDHQVLKLLLKLADESKLKEKIEAMFSGERINFTENRAVLHTALRNQSDGVYFEGENVMPMVNETRGKLRDFADDVRNGKISANGSKFTDVVNIGIGGSDLGPMMVTKALAPYHDGPNLHFVSNVDSAHISDVLKTLNPKRTLFLIVSKTFTTAETMMNAFTARQWLRQCQGKLSVKNHFVAVSTNIEAAEEFGIASSRVFTFWDWVGGRYSIWSAVGLSVMIAIGAENFDKFLEGANEMDEHFRDTEFIDNLPVLLALIGIWHRNFQHYKTRAVLPYDQRLIHLPAYLQQLDMESNGKQINRDGERIQMDTGPIIWGEPGTNGQHAFYQFLHQGTDVVPVEFLLAVNSHEPNLKHHHVSLTANCLAQSQALMKGRSIEVVMEKMLTAGVAREKAKSLAAHRNFQGNRPSITLLYKKLNAKTLGKLLALYEHRVFVEGVIWDINSFDQWGVELGKELALTIESSLSENSNNLIKTDASYGLVQNIKKWAEK